MVFRNVYKTDPKIPDEVFQVLSISEVFSQDVMVNATIQDKLEYFICPFLL